MEKGRFTRREFMQMMAGTGATFLLTACGIREESVEPTPQPIDILPSPAEQIRLARHREFHYPIIEGKEVPADPYLTLPFRESDVKSGYDITEGWIYSQEEQAIHGFIDHNAVDIAGPYGTLVTAPSDGFAMSSYHTFWLKDNSGRTKTYQGKPLRFGLGYFVQMYIPSVNRFIQMAHLSDIDPSIPFSVPVANGDDWSPTNHTLKVTDIRNHPQIVEVKRGMPLGKIGFSGLAFGYEDYSAGVQRPVKIDPNIQKSWDEPHVHFEEFWRDQNTGQKIQRDPYGIYSTARDYPTLTRKGLNGENPLFFIGNNSLPVFAE